MHAHLGFFLNLTCLILSIYGTFAAIGAAKFRHRRLYRSAKMSATVVGILATIASGLLLFMLYQRDYSVGYIFRNSSNDLPAFYTLSAFWSALEGSHMLWTLFLAWCSVVAHWSYNKDNEHIMPHVSAAIQAILVWMFYLTITYSDPFLKQFPVAENGQGMNALLQNFYMAIHPPTLFLGYTTAAIPFAYSVAALAYGDITEGWLRTTRRWALISWIFLTVGIVLGGRWAYVELGWAGYWAWDPVENSSFLPWLCMTALLHSLIVQEKIGHLKRVTIILAPLGFFFAFFGTFITRSGVITSVHSFAQSPIGPNYVAFLGLLFFAFSALYILRAPSILPADSGKVWGVSRESALVVSQFILLTFVAIVFIGTMYPIVSEAITGARFNIQAPYFNAFAPYIGLALIGAIALGNLLRYQAGGLIGGKKGQVISAGFGVLFLLVFGSLADVWATRGMGLGVQVVGIWMIGWASGCLTVAAYDRLQTLKFNKKLFWSRNRAFIGGYLAHLGLLVAILGFFGNYRTISKTVSLSVDETTELYSYEFKFTGMKVVQDQNATLFTAPLTVTKNGKPYAEIHPARSRYPTKPELLHEIGLHASFWGDLYVVLSDFERGDGNLATFEIYINPTVKLVWISCVIMALGGFISVIDPLRGLKSRDSIRST